MNDVGSVRDSIEDTVEAFQKAARSTDVIVTTGGMSVGEEDYIKPAVERLGHIDMWRLAVKPGKPFAFRSSVFRGIRLPCLSKPS